MSNCMASQDAKISKFEADFKQYQSEVTNKLDAFLKAFNDQMMGVLPSDMVIARDAEVNLFKDVFVFKKMVEFLGAIPINLKGNMWESEDLGKNTIDWDKPPKEGDGAWHIRVELIDPDGEKFDRAFQSIPTTRKLSPKKSQVISLTWIISMIPSDRDSESS
ncbi:hypothetical protein Tco_0017741 [Tanacetum coccineum]